MPITLDGTNGITTPSYGGTVTAEYSVPVTAFKNRIINGAMMIDQRNAGNTQTLAQWAKELNMNYDKLRSRVVRYKWSLDRAFEEGNTPEPAESEA